MNRKIHTVYVLAFLFLLVGALVSACAQTKLEMGAPSGEEEMGDPAALDGKALTEERCTKCHDLQRVEAAQKTAEEWKSTVERMVGRGAELDQAEQEAVIEYLAEAYPK